MTNINNQNGNSPAVTVYIPSHNYGRFLGEAIESVLRQSFTDWELLIIDDASDDNTGDVMSLYAHDPKIRLFRTEGIGLPSVANLALSESRAKYILRLDGDDTLDENILLLFHHYLESHASCAIVFSDFYLVDINGKPLVHERRQKLHHQSFLTDQPANGACSLIRVSALRSVGGYREDLGAQDGFDLWSKLRNEYEIANINLPLFNYRRHGQNLTGNSTRILNARRSIKRDFALNTYNSFRPMIAVLPCRSLYDFRHNMWSSQLAGKSLLQHKLEVLSSCSILDYIIVASDNEDVCNVISQFNDERILFFKRTKEETLRSVPIGITLRRIILKFDPEAKGLTFLTYCSSPFVSKQTVEESIHTLIYNEADSCVGVEEMSDIIYQRTAFGLQPINEPSVFTTDHDSLYRTLNVAVTTKNSLIKRGAIHGPVTVHFVMDSSESFFIDSEYTYRIAEVMNNDRA